ncbi:MAG: hypothetical protein JRJ84_17835 [Deltaproteobacteria bacterium]|nr:hypothetical protein [Deltaproteobacteria bacterium]
MVRSFAFALLGLLGACAGSMGLPSERLPRSTSVAEIPETEATLGADLEAIRVDGVRVAALPPSDELIVTAAFEALRDRVGAVRAAAAQDPQAPDFRGVLTLEVDRDLPSRVLLQLVYTGAQAGFAKQWLVVADRAGQRRGISLALPEVSAVTAAAPAKEEKKEKAGTWANPRLDLDPARGFVLHLQDDVVDPGPGLVLGCTPSPCTAWPFVELNRLARRTKLDHPRDRTIQLIPEGSVPLQVLVGTLDATRDDRIVGHGARELFPVVQLALAEETP